VLESLGDSHLRRELRLLLLRAPLLAQLLRLALALLLVLLVLVLLLLVRAEQLAHDLCPHQLLVRLLLYLPADLCLARGRRRLVLLLLLPPLLPRS
jgi:hypothetical protein